MEGQLEWGKMSRWKAASPARFGGNPLFRQTGPKAKTPPSRAIPGRKPTAERFVLKGVSKLFVSIPPPLPERKDLLNDHRKAE